MSVSWVVYTQLRNVAVKLTGSNGEETGASTGLQRHKYQKSNQIFP